MTISQDITTLPPAPQRTDPPAVFVPKADAHVASLDQFVGEINTFGDQVNTTQDEINTAAGNASDSADASASSAVDSANSASASAGSANFVGDWGVATGSATTPSSYTHNGGLWLLTVNLVDITASEPSTTNSDWFLLDGNFTGFIIPDAGTMVWKANNEFQTSATVTIPRADLVNANAYLDVYVSEKHKGVTITIEASGADEFDDGEGGTDPQLILSFPIGGYYRISSNGVNILRV